MFNDFTPPKPKPYAAYHSVDVARIRPRKLDSIGATRQKPASVNHYYGRASRHPYALLWLQSRRKTERYTRFAIHWLNPYSYQDWRQRVLHVSLLVLILAGIIVPVLQATSLEARYVLAASEENLVGKTNANLVSKLTFDNQKQQYVFNAKGIQQDASGGNPVAQLRQQVGGGAKKSQQSYSVELPVDLSQGLSYYDNSMNISFKLIPQFATSKGEEVNNRVVYPMDGGGKLVYSFKGNGLKEDILLDGLPKSGSVRLNYKLELPNSLQARLESGTGAAGIYSADPALFGNISYSTSKDQALVARAREKSKKDHLVFILPPPIINQAAQKQSTNDVHFTLQGSILSVVANKLSKLHFPISIDPSVVVTSTADFSMGNNEGNISYPANQINRGNVTGGSGGTWTAASNIYTNCRVDLGSAVYNGYLYIAGGFGCPSSNYESDIQYAAFNSNGSMGTWTTSGTALPYGNGNSSNTHNRADLSLATYSGYLYVVAGWNGTTYYNDVWYDNINTNGSIGANFTQTTSFTTGRIFASVVTYNNYMYLMGGQDSGSNYLQDVEYAKINADGSISNWASTSLYSNKRFDFPALAYNGFMYLFGGYGFNGSINTWYSDVLYAKINSDGTLGTWNATTSMTSAREAHTAVVYNGYVYLTGGKNSSYLTVAASDQYAAINANGTLGAWQSQSNNYTNNRANHASAVYNGYIYVLGGYSTDAVNYLADVQYSPVDPAGISESYTVSGNTFTTNRFAGQEVAYNGYLYILGGTNLISGSGSATNTVYYAAINGDGSIGSFASTTSFTNNRAWFSAFAYQGYMFVVGGCGGAWTAVDCGTSGGGNLSSIVSNPINSSGTLTATWTATTAMPQAIYGLGTAVYNGYIYVVGGIHLQTFRTQIYYNTINNNGTVGATWTTSGQALSTATAYMGVTAYAGNIYIVGGCTAGPFSCSTVTNNVYYATAGNGDIGTLTSTNNFTTARGLMGLTVGNGFLYLSGGLNNGTYYQDTQYVPINTNGTLGTWASSSQSTLNTTRAGIGEIFYNGFLYASGGYDGTTYYNNVQSATVNNGGSGTTGSWTAIGSNFSTNARAGLGTVAYGGYLYVAGGANGAQYNDLYYATINIDGTLGSWTTNTNNLPASREGIGLVAYNGYMYFLGGIESGTYKNDVYHASINAGTGAVGTWSSGGTDASFSTGRYYFGATAYNGYLYIAGGAGAANYNDVQYASLNASTGLVGTWTTSTHTFTNIRSYIGLTIYNGYMYVVGGRAGATSYNDVQYTQINAGTGDVGAFAATTPFTTSRYGLQAISYNGFLYMVGGYDGSTYYGDVQVAPINPNGTIGNWNTSVSSFTGRAQFGAATYDGFIYMAGGINGGGALNTTYYSPLTTIARIGEFSKLIDFGTVGQVSSITYNGTLPNGTSSFSLETAYPSATFGSLLSASGIASCFSNTYAGRYVWVSITVDDTQTGTFPDANGADANVTDFTVNYSTGPSPGTRLRTGSYFCNGVLQPLDTFGP